MGVCFESYHLRTANGNKGGWNCRTMLDHGRPRVTCQGNGLSLIKNEQLLKHDGEN